MMSNYEEYNLTITRQFPVSREGLFALWIEPEALQGWFRPSATMTTALAETALRTGGDYRIEVYEEGELWQVFTGLYHRINEPAELAFTWRWETAVGETEATYVELTFTAVAPNRTKLTLFHDEFLEEADRDQHQIWWEGILAQLAAYLE